MYNVSLIGIFITNPPVYNEYIPLKIYNKKELVIWVRLCLDVEQFTSVLKLYFGARVFYYLTFILEISVC
jgi:hypothetical protein